LSAKERDRRRERREVRKQEYLPIPVFFEILSYVVQNSGINTRSHTLTHTQALTHTHTRSKAGLTLLLALEARNSMECLAPSDETSFEDTSRECLATSVRSQAPPADTIAALAASCVSFDIYPEMLLHFDLREGRVRGVGG
jgi:hypothetical protein